ncbi:hypothetical protein ESZ53_10515 [Salinibacterium sp. UTAS2018]|uniref:hypothetical protein n=1 Tax=Salinibacterium sp. UTAS2018 TaxID=2508880 RepID=UPI00100964DE|nr:hypothetical protein [Salinibacterium sp. UTAS2018]QAV70834.1 hypothetical protein ESZ53_10515 [Salinibacterium sp. UTAS2018]
MSIDPTNAPAETSAEATTAGQSPAAPASSNRAVAFGGVGLGIGLVLGLVIGLAVIPAVGSVAGSVAGGVVDAAQPSPIIAATETCGVEDSLYIVVGDDGASLSMDSTGEESKGAPYSDILCVLDELDTPDSVLNRINSTRALDGRQSADWGNFSASWGYHPNSGANIIIDFTRD